MNDISALAPCFGCAVPKLTPTAIGHEYPCGSCDPHGAQCHMDLGHKKPHEYTIPPPEQYFEDHEEMPERCSHGVWMADFCYKCAEPTAIPAQEATGFAKALDHCNEVWAADPDAETPAQEAKSGWIDVNQELPPKSYGHNYLVWCKCENKDGGYRDTAAFGDYICEIYDPNRDDPRYIEDNDDGNWQGSGWHREEDAYGGAWDTVFVDLNDKVTHWQPLPAPPEVKK